MARKNILKHVPIAVAKSLATTFTSDPTLISYLDNISYQINVVTSNSTGTFSVQASDDYQKAEVGDRVENPGQWVDLVLGGGTPTVAAANDTILISLNQLPFNAVRLVYTAVTPGTGTCSIIINAKQLGG